jgi:putative transposase
MDQLAGLTEGIRKRALERFRLLQPHLEDDGPLKLVATEAEIPFRTAQRWVALYRKFGLAALRRRARILSSGKPKLSATRYLGRINQRASKRASLEAAAACVFHKGSFAQHPNKGTTGDPTE